MRALCNNSTNQRERWKRDERMKLQIYFILRN